MKNFYVTTPIYYVNDVPHLGTAYCTIAADVLARYSRVKGKNVHFLTGTDEHGEKIQEAAAKKGIAPQEFTDSVSEKFRTTWDQMNISYDDFIRTTEDRHKKVVDHYLTKAMESGDIYLGEYEGWYCVSDETFFTESQLVNGKSPTGKEVKKIKEENYFFKLSKFVAALKKHIHDNPDFILPETKRNEVLSFLEEDIRDISISRTTFSWGIPFPKQSDSAMKAAGQTLIPSAHKKHVVYVWFDALLNYVSALDPLHTSEKNNLFKTFWGTETAPKAIHLVGKDILRFHAVYWPCFLMSVGLPLPKRIFAHGWWTIEGEKMSKSLGNTIEPLAFTAEYGADSFRLFLFREFPMGQDGDFSLKNFKERVNADLANNLGNLVSRSLNLVTKNLGAEIFDDASLKLIGGGSAAAEAEALKDELLGQIKTAFADVASITDEHYEKFDYSKILNKVFAALSLTNKFVEERAPWALAKDPAKLDQLKTVLTVAAESVRLAAIVLWPFIPTTSEEILRRLGQEKLLAAFRNLPEGSETISAAQNWGAGQHGKVDMGTPLFMRLQ